jgi:hypothetical protein
MGTPTKTYARSRHVDPAAVRRGIRDGVIAVDDNGQIADPEQADAAWLSTRRASRMGQHQNGGEDGVRAAEAKIALARAKLDLARQRLDATRERFVDRGLAIEVGEREATYVIEALRAAPAGYAGTLAVELDIQPDVALRILNRFIGLTLVEIGDLPRQARRDAERA